jgi:hypothetical protein
MEASAYRSVRRRQHADTLAVNIMYYLEVRQILQFSSGARELWLNVVQPADMIRVRISQSPLISACCSAL